MLLSLPLILQAGKSLAMVGSRSFFDTAIDGQYNAALASRQPGSAMKPFIYSLALMNDYTATRSSSMCRHSFSTSCRPSDISKMSRPCYAPTNYDNKFRGPMTFETALAQSINIPAIKVLYLVGIQNAIQLAKSFGLTTLEGPNQYGLTLVLGGGEVRLLDLAGAYAVLANEGGEKYADRYTRVTDTNGNVFEKYESQPSRIVPENIARDMSAMRSDAPARLPEYPLDSPLFSGYDVAVKTGTTDVTRDAWVIGYTPSIVLGVWVGNNDNSPMVKSVAGFIAAPMWHEAMVLCALKISEDVLLANQVPS